LKQCRWKCRKITLTFGAPGRGTFSLFLVFGFITMVDIHSVAASSHPSRHGRETEGEATSRSRAGRPRRAGGRLVATTVVVESQPQRTAVTAAAPPAVVGVDATLLAVSRLLNNPPLSRASPSAAEQWRNDVNHLVVAAINTSPQERWRQPSAQYSRTPSAAWRHLWVST
jgi:hypothetical protein